MNRMRQSGRFISKRLVRIASLDADRYDSRTSPSGIYNPVGGCLEAESQYEHRDSWYYIFLFHLYKIFN